MLLPEREIAPRGAETVLLVDTDPGIRRLASFMLDRQGYRVLEARSAADALRVSDACDSEIHLLVTAQRMYPINGRELARRIVEARPRVRVLYLTDADAADAEPSLLHKPFTMLTLAGKVRRVLDEPRERAVGA